MVGEMRGEQPGFYKGPDSEGMDITLGVSPGKARIVCLSRLHQNPT